MFFRQPTLKFLEKENEGWQIAGNDIMDGVRLRNSRSRAFV
jgi:hypothetical protein